MQIFLINSVAQVVDKATKRPPACHRAEAWPPGVVEADDMDLDMETPPCLDHLSANNHGTSIAILVDHVYPRVNNKQNII